MPGAYSALQIKPKWFDTEIRRLGKPTEMFKFVFMFSKNACASLAVQIGVSLPYKIAYIERINVCIIRYAWLTKMFTYILAVT